MLPSLHVGMAVVCAVVYSAEFACKYTTMIWAWTLAISVSTLFTHEHHLFDVTAGGALGFVIATQAKSVGSYVKH